MQHQFLVLIVNTQLHVISPLWQPELMSSSELCFEMKSLTMISQFIHSLRKTVLLINEISSVGVLQCSPTYSALRQSRCDEILTCVRGRHRKLILSNEWQYTSVNPQFQLADKAYRILCTQDIQQVTSEGVLRSCLLTADKPSISPV